MDGFEADDVLGTGEFAEEVPIRPKLNLDVSTWEGWINSWVLYAAQNPWEFLYYVLLGLSPFFLVSIYLSMKLAKAIEAEEKEAKRKARREANVSKVKRQKAD